MSGIIKGEVAFYDAFREGSVRIVEAADGASLVALEQMAAALASVIVEKAPDEAARIWLGAGVDVRLRPAKIVGAAHGSRRGLWPILAIRAWRGRLAGPLLADHVLALIYLVTFAALAVVWGRG